MLNTSKNLTNSKLLLLSIVALLITACSDSVPSDQLMVQKANEYLAHQQLREATIELKNALQENPKNAEARFLLGGVNLDIGDNASAEKEFRRAEAAGWPEEQARTGLARAMINGKSHQKLLDDIKVKDTYYATTQANLHGLRAIALLSLGQMDKAKESLVLGVATKSNALHLYKAEMLLLLAEDDAEAEHAASKLKEALSDFPDDPEILLLGSSISILNNDRQAAMTAYQRVIDMDPDKLITIYGRKARLELAGINILDRDFDQAESILEPLLKQNANDLKANYIGGMLAFEQGDLELAEERLLRLLKIAPGHLQSQLLYGTVCFAQKDYEQAVYYLAKYTSSIPGNLAARKLLGRSYIMLGQHTEARDTLKPMLETNSDDPELLTLISLAELEEGKVDSGIEGLEKAVQTAPQSKVIREKLAKAYISKGETDSAIRELSKVIDEGGGNEETVSLLLLAYLRAGEFDQATSTVSDLLSKNPEDPAVLTQAGNVYAASGDAKTAKEYLTRALNAEPGYLPASMTLANIEETEGNYDSAIVIYRGLVDRGEKSILPMLALARISGLQRRPAEKLNWLEKAHSREPGNIQPLSMLGEHYLSEKQPSKARPHIKEALKIAPDNSKLLSLMGRVMMAEKQYNEALPLLNELVSEEPGSVYARSLLGEAYLELGQTEDAKKHLDIALEKQPNNAPVLALRVTAELQAGQPGRALDYAVRLQKAHPDLFVGHELAGDALLAAKDYAGAKTAYSQAWELQASAALAIKLSEAAKRSGTPEDSARHLLVWLQNSPDDAQVTYFLGEAYLSMGQQADAIAAFEKALTLQPENVLVLNNLAMLYSLSGNSRAIELAERAYRKNPENAGIQDTYGWILVQQGQADKGRRMLEQAMIKLPSVAEIRYHYAVALLKTGKKAQAMDLLRELVDSGQPFQGKLDAEKLLESG